MEEKENKTVPEGEKKERFNLLNPFGRLYRQRQADPELGGRTILFGLVSIAFSAACVGLAKLGVEWAIKGIIWSCTTYMGILTILLGIGNIITFGASVGLFFIPYYLWIYGAVLVIMQFRLHKGIVAWLALIVWLASVVGIFYVSAQTFAAITGVDIFYIFNRLRK